MKPKNHKSFFEDVAKEIEVHKDVVDDLVTFYYNKVRKSKLERAIKRQKDILGNLEKMTYKGFEKYIPVKKKLKQMEIAFEKLKEKINNKKKFRNETK